MNINLKAIASVVYFGITGSWGFKRGADSYHYETYVKYARLKEPFFYSKSILYGTFGCVMYMSPVVIFLIPKEIYRLEVNLRNLEEEKQKDYYNMLV